MLLRSLAAALLLTGNPSNADTLAHRKAQLDTLVPPLLKEHNVPAVSIAVANQDGLTLAATYGEAKPGEAATEETLFNVASVTKLLAAETILQLAASGTIELDQPMAPTFVDPDIADDPRALQLTPRHALAHQTGFPNWRSMLEDKRLAFQFDPGSRPGYSGEGFEYVARYAEAVTNKTFPDLVAEMTGLGTHQDRVAFTDGSPYASDFAWSRIASGEFAPADASSTWSAADNLYVSAATFAGFLGRLLDGSLPPSVEKDRRTIQFDMTQMFCGRPAFAKVCPKAIGFGLSGIIFRYENETVLWQGGGDKGEKAIAFYVPEKNLAVVIFTNGVNGARLFSPIASVFYDNPDYIEYLRIQGEQG
ncbi:MAG: serine hydrolase domain-containing protein [Pseudomonadota bacterium]